MPNDRILVVDDEETIREIVCSTLSGAHFQTRAAGNGIEALADALEAKDAETEGHCRRVTAFTIAIARKMGLPKEEINVIARGAFLHDIGKMAIPDAILLKPSKLTDDEMAIMREHCYRGYKIVSRIPFLAEAAEIVYSHQDHYDGQ